MSLYLWYCGTPHIGPIHLLLYTAFAVMVSKPFNKRVPLTDEILPVYLLAFFLNIVKPAISISRSFSQRTPFSEWNFCSWWLILHWNDPVLSDRVQTCTDIYQFSKVSANYGFYGLLVCRVFVKSELDFILFVSLDDEGPSLELNLLSDRTSGKSHY